jgi:metal-responsive CopG/Arc/MetJ family transcriptional regulator
MATPKQKKGEKSDVVRFNVYLPREAYESLERLRQLSGKRSLAETIRSALQLYLVIREEVEGGKQVILENKEGGDREKLRMMYF